MPTVAELIEQLSKLDQSKTICIDGELNLYITSWKDFVNKELGYGLDTYEASSTDIADYEILHKFPSID